VKSGDFTRDEPSVCIGRSCLGHVCEMGQADDANTLVLCQAFPGALSVIGIELGLHQISKKKESEIRVLHITDLG